MRRGWLRGILGLMMGVSLLIPEVALAEERLTMGTLDWPPYVDSAARDQGYVGLVIHEAFSRVGLEVELRFTLWTRVLDLARHGEVDMYGPEYSDPSLEREFVLSDPFPAAEIGFFSLRESNIHFNGLIDLHPYRIAVVRGYVNNREFDDADYLQKTEVVDEAMGMRMLVAGRVQLVLADRLVGRFLMENEFADYREEVVFLEPALEEKQLHVCFPRRLPESENLAAAFNTGLESMRMDGTLARLYNDLIR
ncbi:MAG: transporter substrate-binding domain-containing protein [Desulfovibrionaceae bacterium]